MFEERGQVAPLLALFAVGIGLACLGLGRFAGGAVDAASARTAADAAALAGADAGGEPAARSLAAANGGRLESFEAAGGDVRVRVHVGPHVVTARARSSASVNAQAGMSASGFTNGLAPGLRAAIARAEQLLGQSVPVTSGFRSTDEQRRLWLGRAGNRFPVATPGTSMHERGLAVDVPESFAERLAAVGARRRVVPPVPDVGPGPLRAV